MKKQAAVSRQIYAVPDLCCIVSRRLVESVGGVLDPVVSSSLVYKFKFDLQPGSLTDQVAGEHQPSYKHP